MKKYSVKFIRRVAVGTALVMCVAASASSMAQERVAPETQSQVQLSFAPLVKKTAPAAAMRLFLVR